MTVVTVVGGGLAGCEAAVQLARCGLRVRLVEMRPARPTPAHQTDGLGELVCTNSFKSEDPANAHGQLKREMRALGSVLLASADRSRVAAGSALAVDRHLFSRAMTEAVEAAPEIEVERREVTALPDGPTVVATGPLTSDALSSAIQGALGDGGLAFFDAIAPIVHRDSLDEAVVFEAGRFGEDADYLNCPMSREEYDAFIAALKGAEAHEGHDWDAVPYFEGCLPIEVMAHRGDDTLRFGPMKPIGLVDPRTGRRPWAVVQFRREDRAGQMWNMVGFQTRLRIGEQRRVFGMIPGLAEAEFLRWGSIHRNSYLNFPGRLTPWGALRDRPEVYFAGQLTGVEGYTESAASGILAGVNLARVLAGGEPTVPPPTTMMGGLYRYLRECEPGRFQPMNSNWGLVDPLPGRIRDKQAKREALAARAQEDFLAWMAEHGLQPAGAGVASGA
ncbi:MAG: methylenetetrahydrofolate--tRNA-(uracil-5-)-methyltransferase TrmFO [Gemmatimonadota bacterium]